MNKKIYALLFCIIPVCILTQESEIVKTREELLHDYVGMYPHLHEGFDVIHDKYRMGPTFYDFLDSHVSIKDEEEQSSIDDISLFGNVVHEAEDYIFTFMKPRFLKKINQLIQDPSIEMNNTSNPAFTYVVKYQDGFMQLVVEKWVNGRDLFQVDEPIIVTTGEKFCSDRKDAGEIKYHHPYACTNKPKNLLSLAIENDNEMMVRLLIVFGADINDYYAGYIYPLHTAVSKNTNMVATLLSLGANYNVQGYKGATPLYDAVVKNKIDVVKLLLDAGANPDIADNAGFTPLHKAVMLDKNSMIQLLLDAGADINRRTKQGLTPLIVAAFFNKIEGAKILVAANADISIADNEGRTALMMSNAIEMSNIITHRGNQSKCVIS